MSSQWQNLMFVDTQVLSYAYKSQDIDIRGAHVSSVAVNEFLEVHDGLTKANYFVPRAGPATMLNDFRWREHPPTKMHTDQFVLDFGGMFPPLIEYGSFAVAEAINARATHVFDSALRHLPKPVRKKLRARAMFILEAELVCVPLVKSVGARAQEFLRKFIQHHQLKRNFRNSMADLLILAAASEAGTPLLTKDNVLTRFAAEIERAPIHTSGKFIQLSFQSGARTARRHPRESRGYINRGWSVHFRNVGFGKF